MYLSALSGCAEEEKPAWTALNFMPQGQCEAFFWSLVYLPSHTPTIIPASKMVRNSNT